MPHRRIVFPLDVASEAEAWEWCFKLRGEVGVMKVGLELFTALGPNILSAPRASKFDIFLDLKLHDIPATVAKSTISAANLGAKFLTVHASGGPTMMRAAVDAAREINPNMTILAVTVLTSLTEDDLDQTYGPHLEIAKLTETMAMMAWQQGARGFVCSPLEAGLLRARFGDEATFVVPGVRPAGADDNDQKRIATPAKAMEDGADYLVVGRPIRHALDPVAAAREVAAEIRPFV